MWAEAYYFRCSVESILLRLVEPVRVGFREEEFHRTIQWVTGLSSTEGSPIGP